VSGLIDLERAAEWFNAVKMLSKCDQVIREYAEAGISGTLHDLEHRRMREEYARVERDLRP